MPNALAAAAIAAELGLGTGRHRRRAVRGDGPQPVADGGRGSAPDGVTVINDAYNANPESVRAALDALGHLAAGRAAAFAVLGQMAELGEESRDSHEEAGAQAAGTGVAGLIVVAKEAAPILDGAQATSGWHGEALGVPDIPGAIAALRGRLAPGDVVLVKASRAAGLERVAAALLSQPASEKETAQ